MYGRWAIALLVTLGSASQLLAQSADTPPAVDDSAGFVVLKNQDTVAVERFERSDVTWKGTLLLVTKKDVADTWSIVTAPDGTVPLVEVMESQKPPDPRMRPRMISRARIIMKGDSVAVDQMTPNGLITRVFQSEAGAVPYLNLSFGMLEVGLRQAAIAARTDSLGLEVYFFNLGGGQTARGTLVRKEGNAAVLSIGEVSMNLELAPDGKLLSVAIPAQGLKAQRTQ